jgi:hypothetical protein
MMEFVPCNPMQTVAALLLLNTDAQCQLAALQQRTAVFTDLGISAGADWLCVQGVPDPEHQGEFLLPSLLGSIPLYLAEKDIYCVVGWQLAAPENLASSLLLELKRRLAIQDMMIVYPTGNRQLDIYDSAQPVPLHLINVERVTKTIMAG